MPAEAFLRSYFPSASPVLVAEEQHGAFVASMFVLENDTYLVLSQARGDERAPRALTDAWFLSYDAEGEAARPSRDAQGVFVICEPIYERAARRARFSFAGMTVDAEVRAGHAACFAWDAVFPVVQIPQLVALSVDDAWVPCVVPGLGASARAFADAFRTGHATGDASLEWATNFRLNGPLSGPEHFAYMMPLLQAIVDHSSPEDAHLGNLGAGAVEDMFCPEFMDHVERDVAHKRVWQAAISGAYLPREAPELHARIRRFLRS